MHIDYTVFNLYRYFVDLSGSFFALFTKSFLEAGAGIGCNSHTHFFALRDIFPIQFIYSKKIQPSPR